MHSITIDYSLCVGCGACAEMYPEHFILRDDKAWLLRYEMPDTSMIDGVISVCIYGAISIEGPGATRITNQAPTSRGRGGRRGR